jgi:hypothetical protein
VSTARFFVGDPQATWCKIAGYSPAFPT